MKTCMLTRILRLTVAPMLVTILGLFSQYSMAGVDSCLKAALHTANPDDLKKAAAFAANHGTCLQNLVPPSLVPYVALSGSLDAANQSGALGKLGLGFSNYQQCTSKVNPGKATIKQLAPVLKPVCGTLNMNCQMFEGQASDEVNAQLASEAPLLNMLPCACAAATSGLGVEKIAELVKETQQCGAALQQVGEAFQDAAVGVYKIGGDALDLGKDAASEAVKLGESIVKNIGSVGCAVSKLWGGCQGTPPSYKTTATAICKAHQSTWWAASKTGGPSDVFVQCNDGLYCWAWPGESLRCEMRRTLAQRNSDIAQMKQWCPQREQTLQSGYQLQCHDGLCKVAVTNVASQYGAACSKLVQQSEAQTLPTDVPGAEMKAWLGKEESGFVSKFDQLIRESVRRDPKVTPVQLLATYECHPFLGREDQSLCKWSGGFQACKKLVDAKKLQRCLMPDGTEYPTTAIGTRAQSAGLEAGANLPAANLPVVVRGVRPLTTEQAPITVSDTFLSNAAKKGCRPWRNNRDQLTCDNPAGYDECVQAVEKRYLRRCRNTATDETYPKDPLQK